MFRVYRFYDSRWLKRNGSIHYIWNYHWFCYFSLFISSISLCVEDPWDDYSDSVKGLMASSVLFGAAFGFFRLVFSYSKLLFY